jgi:D-glycero-D-manno-heptose 1,7-bisphosphate phosphatase
LLCCAGYEDSDVGERPWRSSAIPGFVVRSLRAGSSGVLFRMKLVILDRDGVINEDSPNFIRSANELRFIEGSLRAVAKLTHAGYSVAVATNQSGIARRYFDAGTLNGLHSVLCARAAAVGARIDAFAFCPHGPTDRCSCRKPAPGLLSMLARRFAADIEQTPFIGDSLRDLQAAQAAGAIPILVRTGNGTTTSLDLPASLSHVLVYDDLRAAVDAWVTR